MQTDCSPLLQILLLLLLLLLLSVSGASPRTLTARRSQCAHQLLQRNHCTLLSERGQHILYLVAPKKSRGAP
jgi:hypothetical protein